MVFALILTYRKAFGVCVGVSVFLTVSNINAHVLLRPTWRQILYIQAVAALHSMWQIMFMTGSSMLRLTVSSAADRPHI